MRDTSCCCDRKNWQEVLNIKNAEDRREVKLNKIRFLSPEFKELWDNIKH